MSFIIFILYLCSFVKYLYSVVLCFPLQLLTFIALSVLSNDSHIISKTRIECKTEESYLTYIDTPFSLLFHPLIHFSRVWLKRIGDNAFDITKKLLFITHSVFYLKYTYLSQIYIEYYIKI